jgi:hypothetical protein
MIVFDAWVKRASYHCCVDETKIGGKVVVEVVGNTQI